MISNNTHSEGAAVSPLIGCKLRCHTLGCKLNFAETASLQDQLYALGAREAKKGEVADVVVVNTCSVTGEADQKCRQGIRRLVRQNPGACVVVMGCYAQLKPDEIRGIDGVTFVLSQQEKGRAAEYICQYRALGPAFAEDVTTRTEKNPTTFVPSCSRGNRTRYFLKVQDGCNYFCTYCTIPYARGRSRNASIESLVSQAQDVVEQGGKEIVITGVNIGDFGRSTGETFFDLVKALDAVEGIERYRISSIEPNLLTDEIIDFCAQSRAFMPHFHIPLQSGCDEVLKLMHRRYDTALFRHKVERVRQVMPDAFIGVDVIVGTRGETAEYFEQAYDFIDSLDVQQLHVFPYSERPGTRALEIPHVVSAQDKHERSQRLLALSEEKRVAFYRKYQGAERPVLWENGAGWTDNYIRVAGAGLTNTISYVTLGEISSDLQQLDVQ